MTNEPRPNPFDMPGESDPSKATNTPTDICLLKKTLVWFARLSTLGLVAALGQIAHRMSQASNVADPTNGAPLELPRDQQIAKQTITTSDGAQLDTYIVGSGPAVIMVHGMAADHRVWGPVSSRLTAHGLSAILYDHRGHLSSTQGTSEISADRLGDDLADLIDALALSDVILVGHSVGSIAIEAFLARHPESAGQKVTAVLLCATDIRDKKWHDPIAEKIIAGIIGSPTIEKLLQRPKLGQFMFTGLGGPLQPTAHVLAGIETFLSAPGSVRKAMVHATQASYVNELQNSQVPITVAVGENDNFVPPSGAKALADAIPNAKFEIISNAGHVVELEAPDELTKLILDLRTFSL